MKSTVLRKLAIGAALLVTASFPALAADKLSMWSRAAAAAPAPGMIDLWNSTHEATIDQIHEYAKKIHALGPDIYGYYLSGNCGGCNIFTQAPMMWGSGAKLLPKSGDDPTLDGPGVKELLTTLHEMWAEGLIPAGA